MVFLILLVISPKKWGPKSKWEWWTGIFVQPFLAKILVFIWNFCFHGRFTELLSSVWSTSSLIPAMRSVIIWVSSIALSSVGHYCMIFSIILLPVYISFAAMLIELCFTFYSLPTASCKQLAFWDKCRSNATFKKDVTLALSFNLPYRLLFLEAQSIMN